MKQAEDDLTIDLLEGEPVKLTATALDRIRVMDYRGPKDRPACRSCSLLETIYHQPDTLMAFERHWCKRGGFRVQLGGCCAVYERNPLKPVKGRGR